MARPLYLIMFVLLLGLPGCFSAGTDVGNPNDESDTSIAQDTGTTSDVNIPPNDGGSGQSDTSEFDGGANPEDTGNAPEDTGNGQNDTGDQPPIDTGEFEDSGPEPNDSGAADTEPSEDTAPDLPEDPSLTITRDLFYPKGIARAADGTLYVGAFNTGEIVRFTGDITEAQDFVQTGTVQTSATGMYIDDAAEKLHVCGADLLGEIQSKLYIIDIATQMLDAEYPLPEGSFCNGITADTAGNIYITDAFQGRIVRLPTDSDTLEIWLENPTWMPTSETAPLSLSGIDFDGTDTLYVGLIDTGAVFSVLIETDGSPGATTEIHAADNLGVDGLRQRTAGELIMVKGDSLIQLLLNTETQAWSPTQIAQLEQPTHFAFAENAESAWVVQSQLDALLDDDENTVATPPFLIVHVELPTAP